jgi:pyruvate carboxylase
MIIKALADGGGRGTRSVMRVDEVDATFECCQSEAQASFGRDELYVEELIGRARHIEVQILGDLQGGVAHLGERECSVRRRYQKALEIAPAPHLDDSLRAEIIAAAVRLAEQVGYSNLGTFEFLVDVSGRVGGEPFAFIEANARLQVERTVTEEVTGVDLVQSQIQLADRSSLASLGLGYPSVARPRGFAIQARVNMETLEADGTVRPSGGVISVYEAPNEPGVRTDEFGYAGYQTSSAFDSLLAKVICHSPAPGFGSAITRTQRGLSEFRLEEISTNIGFLRKCASPFRFRLGQCAHSPGR